MASPFKFLSISEFEGISPADKRVYLIEATAELQWTTKDDHNSGGWHTLFRQDEPNPKTD